MFKKPELKPQNIDIFEIVCQNADFKVIGLGTDNRLYYWSKVLVGWYLYRS
jgi:hypothetical protein